MRILILNWKDIKHPLAGGAETVTHRYAVELTRLGHKLTLFSSSIAGLKSAEIINGVEIIRRGSLYTVHLWACFYYLLYLRQRTDILIDQIHGVPFFTPLYAHKPILTWIHEVAGEIWSKEFPWPLSFMGQLLENAGFIIYRGIPFLTDSDSTAKELRRYGIDKSRIKVIGLTINKPRVYPGKKTDSPSLVYIGRISPVKRLELVITAVHGLRQQFPELQFTLAGTGKPAYIEKLSDIIRIHGLSRHVLLIGQVSEAEKYKLLSTSWLHIQPSLKEGFGLTVLEAAAVGTPTVCFNVPGLRDLVKNRINGLIVEAQTVAAMTNSIRKLCTDNGLRERLYSNAYNWSKTLPSWKKQAQKLEHLLFDLTPPRD